MSEDTIDDFEPIVILSDAEWAALEHPITRAVAWRHSRQSDQCLHPISITSSPVPILILSPVRLRSLASRSHRRPVMYVRAPQGDLYLFGSGNAVSWAGGKRMGKTTRMAA